MDITGLFDIIADATGSISSATDLGSKVLDAVRGDDRIPDSVRKDLRHMIDALSAATLTHAKLNQAITLLQMDASDRQDFQAKAARYRLIKKRGGSIVYEFYDPHGQETPPHHACPVCYEDHKLSILQPIGDGDEKCPTCKTEFYFG
ncbi:MAG: hypothetical protein AAF415_02365 [Pseudomonadota bacterium]